MNLGTTIFLSIVALLATAGLVSWFFWLLDILRSRKKDQERFHTVEQAEQWPEQDKGGEE